MNSYYTFEEKQIIVDYVVEQKCYSGLRGNSFWQEMESKKILKRSWQSVKEHFRKQIIDNIDMFDIPPKQKKLMKEGWESSRVAKREGNSGKVKRPRYNTDPSEVNICSNEEQQNSDVSFPRNRDDDFNQFNPDLIKKEKIEATPSKLTPDDYEIISIMPDSQNLPSCSYERKSPPLVQDNFDDIIVISSDSDSDDDDDDHPDSAPNKLRIKILTLNNGSPSNTRESASREEEFSLEEDMSFINFIRSNKEFLLQRDSINIYNFYHETHPGSKSPEQLMSRFLNDLFPNICIYSRLTHEEMVKFYNDAGVNMPDNLRTLFIKSKDTNVLSKNKSNKQTQTDCDLSGTKKSGTKCIYCHVTLGRKSHIIVSNPSEIINQRRVARTLARKFKTDIDCVHFTDPVSDDIITLMNAIKASLNDTTSTDTNTGASTNESTSVNTRASVTASTSQSTSTSTMATTDTIPSTSTMPSTSTRVSTSTRETTSIRANTSISVNTSLRVSINEGASASANTCTSTCAATSTGASTSRGASTSSEASTSTGTYTGMNIRGFNNPLEVYVERIDYIDSDSESDSEIAPASYPERVSESGSPNGSYNCIYNGPVSSVGYVPETDLEYCPESDHEYYPENDPENVPDSDLEYGLVSDSENDLEYHEDYEPDIIPVSVPQNDPESRLRRVIEISPECDLQHALSCHVMREIYEEINEILQMPPNDE